MEDEVSNLDGSVKTHPDLHVRSYVITGSASSPTRKWEKADPTLEWKDAFLSH